MHSKQKGNIAATFVALQLQKEGFNVFSELGDYSRIDLIAEKDGILKKIQIKYFGGDSDKMELRLQKSGPNGYRYNYSEKDIDWFAIYSPYNEKIAWLKSSEACEHKNMFTIRVSSPKNSQIKNIHLLEDYSIENFKNDFN